MSKSKRISKANKVKIISKKIVKKEKSHKIDFISSTKALVAEFKNVFVLNINNLRTNLIQRIRDDFRDSKIIFGKKRLLMKALEDTELSQSIKGNECLLFTNRAYEDVSSELCKYNSIEYARTGSISTQDVLVLAQVLYAFNADLEPTLRDLGMPVEMKNGQVVLLRDYRICSKDIQLTNTMSRLLKFFQIQNAEFSAEVIGMWSDKAYTSYELKSNSTITLDAKVEVKCEKLDDDKYYFICYSVEEAMDQ